jgi:GXWXG protein/Domain of unknown function (DUF4334)
MPTTISTSDRIQPAPPDWLSAWLARPLGAADALSRFDALEGVAPDDMLGHWQGRGLATGHPLDGLLETLGWHGKAFRSPDDVQPLLFRTGSGRVVALDPALMPVGAALRWPGLARSAVARAAFAALRPLLRAPHVPAPHASAPHQTARHATARLRTLEFRGRASAAMIYRRQPIVDHFRRIDEGRILGLMEMRGDDRPYFFLLCRAGGGGHPG